MSFNLSSLKTSDVYLNLSRGRSLANLSRLELMNWKLSRKTRCPPNIKAMFFNVLWNRIDIHLFSFSFLIPVCIFVGYFTNLLYNKMAIIASDIMENNWYLHIFKFYLKVIDIIILMSRSSIFSCITAMISYSCLSVYDLPQIWHFPPCLKCFSSSSDIFNVYLKAYSLSCYILTVFLQSTTSSSIFSINL